MRNSTTSPVPRKMCARCKRELPITEFQADKRKAYGVGCYCRDCKRAYRQVNKDKLLVAQYARRVGNAEYNKRQSAYNALYKAVQLGKLRRPDACEVCGSRGHIQGHHDDYSRPLDVIWCCQDCHIELDRARRKAEES